MKNKSPQYILADLMKKKYRLATRESEDREFFKIIDCLEQKKGQIGLNGLDFPTKIFNILNEADKPKKIQENLNIILEILEDEKIRVSEQLVSGESSEETNKKLLIELEFINSSIHGLKKKEAILKKSSYNPSKDRSFLQFLLPTFDQYTRFIATSLDDLSFLKLNHIEDAEQVKLYRKILLDEKELSNFSLIFSSAKTPLQLIELISLFFSSKIPSKRIALCSYESALNGFYLFFEKNIVLNNKLLSLKEKHPKSIEYNAQLKYWVLRISSLDNDFSILAEHFDLWADFKEACFYFKNQTTEIETTLKNIKYPTEYRLEYLQGILFDHTSDPIFIDIKKIEDLINSYNSESICSTENIEIFNGDDFISPVKKIAWTYNELLLLKYENKYDNGCGFFAIYSPIDHEILFTCLCVGYIADRIKILFKNTLSLLCLNAFEQVDPNIILSIGNS